MFTKNKKEKKLQKATFAAGCFWGVEDIFMKTKGVVSTMVGYTGGHKDSPTYKEVCFGDTGHAESVELEFDPDIISYKELLGVFWNMHDPTTMHRQGPDIGEQYRSAIFYHDTDQEELAKRSKEEMGSSGKFKNKIVTEISPASEFYKAEEYHQQYFKKNGLASCHI